MVYSTQVELPDELSTTTRNYIEMIITLKTYQMAKTTTITNPQITVV